MVSIDKKQRILWRARMKKQSVTWFRSLLLIPSIVLFIILLSLSITLPIWGMYTLSNTIFSYGVLCLFSGLMLRSLIKRAKHLSRARKILLVCIYAIIAAAILYAIIAKRVELQLLFAIVFVIAYSISTTVIIPSSE